jgi:hypothetical protein
MTNRAEDDAQWEIHHTIETYRIRWENTGNPLFVWLAASLYGLVRQPDGPSYPDWCLAYLDVAASKMAALAHGGLVQKMTGVTSIEQALGLASRGKSALKAFRSLQERGRDLLAFEDLTQRWEMPGYAPRPPLMGKEKAINQIADKAGLDPRTVKRRLRKARSTEELPRKRGTKPTP